MKNTKIILLILGGILIGSMVGYWFGQNNDHGGSSTSPSEIPKEEHHHETDKAAEYTCSMHPQVRQDSPGDCPLCGMDLTIMDESASDDPLVLKMTKEATKLANIQTTVIGDFASQYGKAIRLSGKVQADERLASSQVAHVPGRIEKLFVSFTGEKVTKGQEIATLYSPELITAQSELLEAMKLQDLNPGLVEAARNKLRFLKISDQMIQNIESRGVIQETFTLLADETGIVTKKRVSVGDHLMQGEPLFDLMNLSKVWILFDAYEDDLATIKIGDRVEFTTPSNPDKVYKTKITFIDPFLDPKTRVASLRAEVSNSYGKLKPEMFVTGILKNNIIKKSRLSVPKTAVMWTGTRSVVYVKLPDTDIPSYQYREVELGKSLGKSYQLLSGIEAGEEVVTYGSFTIDAAAQLNNQSSMMNKNVSIKGKKEVDVPDYKESTPLVFKEQLSTLLHAYLALKDALVLTDQVLANKKATEMITVLQKVDMSLLDGEPHQYWINQLNAIESHGGKITKTSEVEEQRSQFLFLSEAIIKTVKAFGIPDNTLYVQHCPMADNNEGADWISKERIIQNPYFGDKMMKCGMVTDTLKIINK